MATTHLPWSLTPLLGCFLPLIAISATAGKHHLSPLGLTVVDTRQAFCSAFPRPSGLPRSPWDAGHTVGARLGANFGPVPPRTSLLICRTGRCSPPLLAMQPSAQSATNPAGGRVCAHTGEGPAPSALSWPTSPAGQASSAFLNSCYVPGTSLLPGTSSPQGETSKRAAKNKVEGRERSCDGNKDAGVEREYWPWGFVLDTAIQVL